MEKTIIVGINYYLWSFERHTIVGKVSKVINFKFFFPKRKGKFCFIIIWKFDRLRFRLEPEKC